MTDQPFGVERSEVSRVIPASKQIRHPHQHSMTAFRPTARTATITIPAVDLPRCPSIGRYRTRAGSATPMLPDDLDMWGLPDLDADVSITQFGPRTRRALDSILVPVAGGPNSAAAVDVAADLARYWNAPLDLLTVVAPASDDAARAAAAERLREHADGVDGVPVDVDVCAREDVVAAITGRAQAADLVVIGGSERSLFRRLFAGTIPARLARRSATPIFAVERDATGR